MASPTGSPFRVPDLAEARAGNTGVEGVWHFDSARPGRHLLLTALLHGNEFSGARALLALLLARVRPLRGSLTLAFCNLAAFDRFHPDRPDANRFIEEDMNRVWTAERLAQPTTPERRRAVALLPFVRRADWLLDLHSMHEPCAPLLLTGLPERHRGLARRLQAPRHVVADAGHADGCRLRDFAQFAADGREDALSLLLESGHHFEPDADAVALDLVARFLRLSETVDASQLPTGWARPQAGPQVELEVTRAVVARSADFRFVAPYQGLERIARAGTVIAYDRDEPVVTPHDDCFLVMPSLKQLRPGVTVVRLAARRPFSAR